MQTTLAIAYDFDGTLVPGYMQDHSFFPKLGVKQPHEYFWPKVKAIAKENDMDEILAYMQLMLREANYKNLSLKKEEFIKHGEGMKFFVGVDEWFPRINAYSRRRKIKLHHYIISSGLREMIQGTSISKYFTYVFASGFAYNQDNIATWPALAVNYTNKTQFIFRINKGINNCWDNSSLNKYWGKRTRPVPTTNIIYIGDGETDVPAMKMTKQLGGSSVAVYDREKKEAKSACDNLLKQNRADYSVPADYREGSALDFVIKSIIDKRAIESRSQ